LLNADRLFLAPSKSPPVGETFLIFILKLQNKVLPTGGDLEGAYYICHMTKEQIQDLRDRLISLRRHL
jgi:hypothetical protein